MRRTHNYDLRNQLIFNYDKQIALLQMDKLNFTGKSILYANQVKIANDVVETFTNNEVINVMVISRTQSGKTGAMCGTIRRFLNDVNFIIPIQNIYVITGLSSIEWKEQTKGRFPDIMEERVFHRGDLTKKFIKSIKNKKNVLVIMDEVHIASSKGQTIYKTFKEIGFLDKEYLLTNDIKILEFSATPEGTLYDLLKWKQHAFKLVCESGDGYVSSNDLLKQGRILQFQRLTTIEHITEIKNVIVSRYNDKPLYHIIRTNNGSKQQKTVDAFKNVFNGDCSFINYDITEKINDINEILANKPEQHTFIFIKEMLRCSKTIIKDFIGVVYERCPLGINDAVIIQGLLGRLTGYDDNGFSVCFTNIPSIERYECLYNNNFNDSTIYTNLSSFNDLKYYDNFDYDEVETVITKAKPTVHKFSTYDEAKLFLLKSVAQEIQLKFPAYKSRPYQMKMPQLDTDGFYTYCFMRETRKRDVAEMERIYSMNVSNNAIKHIFKICACYGDKNDKSTLEWWLIHH
jgi:hypothetical protein